MQSLSPLRGMQHSMTSGLEEKREELGENEVEETGLDNKIQAGGYKLLV